MGIVGGKQGTDNHSLFCSFVAGSANGDSGQGMGVNGSAQDKDAGSNFRIFSFRITCHAKVVTIV